MKNEIEKINEKKVNRMILIVVIIIIATICIALNASAHEPFAGKTKHKTVKKMSKRQVKKAKKGKTFYYRKHGKIVKR